MNEKNSKADRKDERAGGRREPGEDERDSAGTVGDMKKMIDQKRTFVLKRRLKKNTTYSIIKPQIYTKQVKLCWIKL